MGKLHFLCIPKSQADNKVAKNAHKLNELLECMTILYCDNTGVMKRVVDANNPGAIGNDDELVSGEYSTAHADMDLDDSMRLNRKSLAKNLPQTNLSAILDTHKSSKHFEENKLIAENRNEILESNLNKVTYEVLKTNIELLKKLK
jgi:hypothetical protein